MSSKARTTTTHLCYYKLGVPNGPFTVGKCEVCGTPRQFVTAPASDYSEREWERLKTQRRGRKRFGEQRISPRSTHLRVQGD